MRTQSDIVVKERARTFLSSRLIYEENGELKLFELPAPTTLEELIDAFEKEKNVVYDEKTGRYRPATVGAIVESTAKKEEERAKK